MGCLIEAPSAASLKERIEVVAGKAEGRFWRFVLDNISFWPSEQAKEYMRAVFKEKFGRDFDDRPTSFYLHHAGAEGEFWLLDYETRQSGIIYLRELKGWKEHRPRETFPWYYDSSFAPTAFAPYELSVDSAEGVPWCATFRATDQHTGSHVSIHTTRKP